MAYNQNSTIKRNPCCCTSLKTGSLFIGVLEIIGHALFTVLSSLSFIGLAYLYTFPGHDGAKIQSEAFGTLIILILSVILGLVGFILGIVLVSGVTKNSHRVLMAYLTLKVMFIVAAICMAITCLCTGATSYLEIETLIESDFPSVLDKHQQQQVQADNLMSTSLALQLVQFCHALTLAIYAANVLVCLCGIYTFFVILAHFRQVKGQSQSSMLVGPLPPPQTGVIRPPFALDYNNCNHGGGGDSHYLYNDNVMLY